MELLSVRRAADRKSNRAALLSSGAMALIMTVAYAGTAFVTLGSGFLVLSGPARADSTLAGGGSGGYGNAAGGTGGVGYMGAAGNPGNAADPSGSGGGGGAAGSGPGGNGGQGTGGVDPGTPGSGATGTTPNGADGIAGTGQSGSEGGQGGANGGTGVTVTAAATGGRGGTGGSGVEDNAGGGGGAGGYGYILTGTGAQTNAFALAGGSGGNGGASFENSAGSAGTGGVGVLVTQSGVTLINSSSISGGAGGAGGTSSGGSGGNGGNGGDGVSGMSLTVINTGTITAGAAGAAGTDGFSPFLNGTAGVAGAAISYTGGTNGLTLSNGGVTGTINGAVAITGSLAIDPGTVAGTNVTLANTIQDNNEGAGSIAKTGAGTLTLTGTNTYTGGTTFGAGVLNVGSTGSLGTSGTLSFTGGTLQYSAANQTDYSARFSAAANQAYSIDTNGQAVTFATALTSTGGALTKLGTGTLTLTGTNTYTGATAITAGTLALTGTGSIASSSVVADAGTFSIAGLTNGGTSITTLSGAGGTTLGANTLTITNGSTTYGGVASGTGGLTVAGGTQTLSGTNTYTGATAITAGTLALTGTGSIAASSVVADAGTFSIAGLTNGGTSITTLSGAGGTTLGANTLTITNGSTTYGGVASGTGGLTVAGGTQTLSGTNTYTGATAITAGTLEVDGSIVSASTVSSGGTLSGTGTVGATTVSGTLSPGNAANPYGTLTATGPLTFQPGSFYNVAITPTQNSFTQVNSTTTINGGRVQVAAGVGAYANNTHYTILTATGGVAGQFAGVTTNLAFLTPTLSYDARDVFLTVLPTVATAAGTPNYRTAAATQNQLAVASGLTNAGVLNGGTGPILTALNQLTVAQARAAFDSLSGEGITATRNLAHRSAELFTSSIFDQTTFYGSDRGSGNQIVLTAPPPGGGFLALAPADQAKVQPIRELADLPSSQPAFIAPAPVASQRTWRAWGTGFGGDEEIHSNPAIGFAAQSNQIYGGAVGVDYQVTPTFLTGVAVGGSDGEFSVPNRATSGSTTGGHVALYSLASFGPAYGAASVSGSFFQNNTTRNVAGFGGLASETEKGNFSSREVRTRLEVGRAFANPYGALGGTITPFVALEIADLRTDGFGEQAIAGPRLFALNVSGQSAADVPAFVGLRFAQVAALGNGMVLKPTLQLAYVHEFAPYRSQFAGIASLPGAVFLVDGARPARDSAQVKAGFELAIGPRTAVFANFDGEFSGVDQLYAGKGGVRYLF